MKIALCLQGSFAIEVVHKIFSLGILPDEITVFTPEASSNQPFLALLNYYKIKTFYVTKDLHILEKQLKSDAYDLLLSISFPFIFKENILKINIKKINLHPGLLPAYRGCFCIPWAIINNEPYLGYSYHLIDSGIDTGPIILQEKFSRTEHMTAFQGFHLIMRKAIEKLDLIVQTDHSHLSNLPQDPKQGKLYLKQLPFKGMIDPNWPIEFTKRFINAMYFPPHTPAIYEVQGKPYEINTLEDFLNLKAIRGTT